MSHYVYVIVNKKNLKLYFGSHSWDKPGVDPNYYGSGKIIKQAVKKYGKENFIIQPIQFYNTVEECRKAEEELLTRYDIANNQYCYNVKNSAIGWTSEDIKGEKHPFYGKHLTEEHKQRIARANKGEKHPWYGRHHTEETRQKISRAINYQKTPVVTIDKNGKVKIFESQTECARKLNSDKKNINKCLHGRQKTCKGYLIKYLKRCSTDYKITKRKAKKTEKIKLTTKRKGSTPVVAIQTTTGRVRMFESLMECARKLNVNPGNIYNCLKGRQKSAGGYTLKKINRDKRVFKVSPRSKADINRLRGIAI